MRIRQLALYILLLNVLPVTQTFSNIDVQLDIKINEISDEEIKCDFIYSFISGQNDSIYLFAVPLPFEENHDLIFNLIANDPNLFFTYGFNNSNKGIGFITNKNNNFDFKAEFINVVLPAKKIYNKTNGLLVNLNFIAEKNEISSKASNFSIVKIRDVTIETETLLDSEPKFSLSEKGSGFYYIEFKTNHNNFYFVIPPPQESYFNTFIALLIVAIIIGFASVIKILKGKTESIIGLISSLILLGFLIFLFSEKVIPTDFKKDIDMIALIGGGMGIAIGILVNSIYNLIVIFTIEKQQS
ncbi:MAG: hypothetical protein D8M58_00940 [Calditrichaeota bacterium]|nr:MAG: hypothetical protein DWQ03_06140 [Calditrichota bacterium]MBL1203933.1 hypothetical protein [Calditrichota bacterium]NOG43766.1 hypothetical protein [Calditrichota bacterium]